MAKNQSIATIKVCDVLIEISIKNYLLVRMTCIKKINILSLWCNSNCRNIGGACSAL